MHNEVCVLLMGDYFCGRKFSSGRSICIPLSHVVKVCRKGAIFRDIFGVNIKSPLTLFGSQMSNVDAGRNCVFTVGKGNSARALTFSQRSEWSRSYIELEKQ